MQVNGHVVGCSDVAPASVEFPRNWDGVDDMISETLRLNNRNTTFCSGEFSRLLRFRDERVEFSLPLK